MSKIKRPIRGQQYSAPADVWRNLSPRAKFVCAVTPWIRVDSSMLSDRIYRDDAPSLTEWRRQVWDAASYKPSLLSLIQQHSFGDV